MHKGSTGGGNNYKIVSNSLGSNNGGNKMTPAAASRIQSFADRNPNSVTAQSGFKERAQSNAAKNQK